MAHVSNFAQGENKIILDLINDDNALNLSDSQVALSAPVINGEKVDVQVTPKQGSGYSGAETVTYNRLDIQAFASVYFPAEFLVQQGDAVNISDLLDEINVALGTSIAPENIVDAPIGEWTGEPNEVKEINLTIAAMSLVYKGSAVIKIDGGDIPISSVISQKVLTGLNMPEPDNGGEGGEGPTHTVIVQSANAYGGMFFGYLRGQFGSIAPDPVSILAADAASADNHLQALHYEPSAQQLVMYFESPTNVASNLPFKSISMPGYGQSFNASAASQKSFVAGSSLMQVIWENVAVNPLPEGAVAVEFR